MANLRLGFKQKKLKNQEQEQAFVQDIRYLEPFFQMLFVLPEEIAS